MALVVITCPLLVLGVAFEQFDRDPLRALRDPCAELVLKPARRRRYVERLDVNVVPREFRHGALPDFVGSYADKLTGLRLAANHYRWRLSPRVMCSWELAAQASVMHQ